MFYTYSEPKFPPRPAKEESNVPKLRTCCTNIYCVLILSCRYMIYLGQLGLDSAKTALIPLPAKLVFLSCLPISTDYQHQIRVFLLYVCIPNILAYWADRPKRFRGIWGTCICSDFVTVYSSVPNRRAGRNKRAGGKILEKL